MLYEIKHRWNGSVLFSLECGSLKLCVEAAVAAEVSLSGSNLSNSDLRGSNLSNSNLRGSNLSNSDLRGSNLSNSNLRGSNLSNSDLSGSDLSGSDLRGSNLSNSDLRSIRDDIWAVLSAAPAEAEAVRDALLTGKINGSCYVGDCCCLVGTIGKSRGCEYNEIPGLTPDSSRLAEVWFFGIKTGDTPETNAMCKQAYEWVDEWVKNMESAFGVTAGIKE